ncbi:hypothetical protein DL93DRAFT_916364 [Clavulina sp. PMI_390]|nr:hypothetical protein DL93DRAFT_916364 [Clavulina sp. PMI_390]
MDDWTALPPSLRREIDKAFNKARVLGPSHSDSGFASRPAKRRRIGGQNDVTITNEPSDDSDEEGGFLVERDDQEAPNDTKSTSTGLLISDEQDSLNLSMVSKAVSGPPLDSHVVLRPKCFQLQLLDLPPDDDDVLAIFKSAATPRDVGEPGEESVSQQEWREVCAILLQHRASAMDGDTAQSYDSEDPEPDALVESELDENSSDEYQDEDDEEEAGGFAVEESSTDEYSGPATSKHRTKQPPKRTHKKRAASDASSDEIPVITPRQKVEARKAFALFFPEVAESELSSQRIMIKDIARVANLLSIKVKTEEIMEMLEAFSTSNDKSISLSDFETLVMEIRLV